MSHTGEQCGEQAVYDAHMEAGKGKNVGGAGFPECTGDFIAQTRTISCQQGLRKGRDVPVVKVDAFDAGYKTAEGLLRKLPGPSFGGETCSCGKTYQCSKEEVADNLGEQVSGLEADKYKAQEESGAQQRRGDMKR